ncbi:MAG TPA: mechanosensitive ion channel domain-containing protein [Stellaceae bacterium]|nr:mechanosensitive ion channel domain-containing protein [Stellaceae bacterium]
MGANGEALPGLLESLALQIGLVAAIFGLAWGWRLATRSLTDPLAQRAIDRVSYYLPYFSAERFAGDNRRIITLTYAWLLLLIAERIAARFEFDLRLVGIAATLSALWIVLRLSALLFRDALLARFITMTAWIVAALDITGLLAPTTAALDSAALTIGTVRLSLLILVKAVLLIAILLWAALALARLIGVRIQRLSLSPSVQVLASNLIKIVLVFLALLIGLNTVGIDLTGVAVFSGAIGVGLGLGLQKVVSNFVSGIILLLERSIKPGDVIEVGQTYGSVTSLGARYTSVRGRDGKEYLIPNETLITNQVINWSYTNPMVRLDMRFGVGYGSDLRQVRQLAIDAATGTRRVLAAPAPVCHITEFADNGVNLMLRFWIEDPANGVRNVIGDIYLALWEAFQAHEVEVPFPQREIRFREIPSELLRQKTVASPERDELKASPDAAATHC